MPKNSKARIDANRRYAEKAYDRLYPFVPKGRKAEIQAAADAVGESLNEYIVKAIDTRITFEQERLDKLPDGRKWLHSEEGREAIKKLQRPGMDHGSDE